MPIFRYFRAFISIFVLTSFVSVQFADGVMDVRQSLSARGEASPTALRLLSELPYGLTFHLTTAAEAVTLPPTPIGGVGTGQTGNYTVPGSGTGSGSIDGYKFCDPGAPSDVTTQHDYGKVPCTHAQISAVTFNPSVCGGTMPAPDGNCVKALPTPICPFGWHPMKAAIPPASALCMNPNVPNVTIKQYSAWVYHSPRRQLQLRAVNVLQLPAQIAIGIGTFFYNYLNTENILNLAQGGDTWYRDYIVNVLGRMGWSITAAIGFSSINAISHYFPVPYPANYFPILGAVIFGVIGNALTTNLFPPRPGADEHIDNISRTFAFLRNIGFVAGAAIGYDSFQVMEHYALFKNSTNANSRRLLGGKIVPGRRILVSDFPGDLTRANQYLRGNPGLVAQYDDVVNTAFNHLASIQAQEQKVVVDWDNWENAYCAPGPQPLPPHSNCGQLKVIAQNATNNLHVLIAAYQTSNNAVTTMQNKIMRDLYGPNFIRTNVYTPGMKLYTNQNANAQPVNFSVPSQCMNNYKNQPALVQQVDTFMMCSYYEAYHKMPPVNEVASNGRGLISRTQLKRTSVIKTLTPAVGTGASPTTAASSSPAQAGKEAVATTTAPTKTTSAKATGKTKPAPKTPAVLVHATAH